VKRGLAFVLAVAWMALGSAGAASAAQEYLLRVNKPTNLDRVCKAHRLVVARSIGWLYLTIVTGPADRTPDQLEAEVRADKNVRTFERDQIAGTGETAAYHPDLKANTATLESALVDRSTVDFYGSPAWAGYVQQPAIDIVGLRQMREQGWTGEGVVVAVIDTGVDPNDPLLKDVLLPGYDFVNDRPGASEWGDVDQSVSAILDQSVSAILDENAQPAILNQSVSAILDSDEIQGLSTAPPLPAAFGHGTMVAGLIHLAAPNAKILPIKAFGPDGRGRSYDVAQAIYYAMMNGANVINMSFSFPAVSQEVMWATAYAALSRVVLVASAGNQAIVDGAWPATHKWVVGVGSTTNWDTVSTFSNYGANAFKIGAPGEQLITTYPGGHYAAASGTSFSAPLVAGSLALMRQADPREEWGGCDDVMNFSQFVIAGRDSKATYRRIVVPTAVANMPLMARDEVKQIKNVR
jgi:subtilisin family serine protease